MMFKRHNERGLHCRLRFAALLLAAIFDRRGKGLVPGGGPIRIVVSLRAGAGGTDVGVAAPQLAQEMAKDLGVLGCHRETSPGQGPSSETQGRRRPAAPDGYTLLMGTFLPTLSIQA